MARIPASPLEDLDSFFQNLYPPDDGSETTSVTTDDPALSVAKEQLFHRVFTEDKGTECPCCGQLVKAYDRKLNRNMIVFLRSLADKKDLGWVNFKNCQFTARDYPYIAFWGLATTRMETGGGTKKFSGYWQITPKGLDFLAGRITVPSHVRIYNNAVLGWSETHTTAAKAYGEGFSYTELMEGGTK